jgi:ankyrin repeat protein
MDAITAEDIAEVTAALDAGANVNHVDGNDGYTPLGAAIQDSDDNLTLLPIIRLLLSRGANVNIGETFIRETPLHLAVHHNNVPAIDILLEAGADVRARNDDGETPRELLRGLVGRNEAQTRLAAAEARNPAPLAAAAQAVQAAVASVVAPAAAPAAPAPPARVPNPEQDRALEAAVHPDDPEDDDDDAARAAILAGADPNLMLHGDRETILIHYVATDNREMVEFLLAHGADVNARAGPGADVPGGTAMDYGTDDDITAILRAAGGRTREDLNGAPPRPVTTAALFSAIRRVDVDAVRDLIARGVNVNAPEEDAHLTTPIQAAAALDNRFDVLEVLVAAGADPAAMDAYGVNAVEETSRGSAYNNRRFLLERFPALAAGLAAEDRPVLSGRSDLRIPPISVRDDYRSAITEGVEWEVIDIPEIFVAKLGRDLTLEQFFRKYMGDGIVFKVGPQFYGVERKDLMKEYAEGSAIAYECRKTFIYNPSAVPPMYGTFEYSDIYATPYFALRTPAGVFYTDLLGMVDILSKPHAFYKVDTTPVKKLENVASRSSVVAGGPVQSQLHCQAKSGENVYDFSPFRLPAMEEDEESDEEEEPNVVFVKKGEEKTEFPLDLAQTVLQLKEAVNAKLGIAIESQKMLFQGKVLQDAQTLGEANVKKGYTIQLQVSGGRLTKKRSTRRGGRTVKQKRGTYKRHGRR